MKKKLTAICIAAMLCVVGSLPIAATAVPRVDNPPYSVIGNFDYYWDNVNNISFDISTVTDINGNEGINISGAYPEDGTSIVIPSKVLGMDVISVSGFHNAYGYYDNVVSITLPETLKQISSSAFLGLPNLETVNIPAGVRYVGDLAFGGCPKLKTLEFPDNSYIGDGIQALCKDNVLYEYVNDSEIRLFNWQFFENENGFLSNDNFTIPSEIDGAIVTEIGNNGFADVGLGFEVTIPETVTKIGDGAFSGSAFGKVYVPESVTEIGVYALLTSFDYLFIAPDMEHPPTEIVVVSGSYAETYVRENNINYTVIGEIAPVDFVVESASISPGGSLDISFSDNASRNVTLTILDENPLFITQTEPGVVIVNVDIADSKISLPLNVTKDDYLKWVKISVVESGKSLGYTYMQVRFLKGDLNQDGEVCTVADTVMISKYILGNVPEIDTYSADINNDDSVNVMDLAVFKRQLVNSD